MEEFLMMRDLHHQGLNISQIARETGYHRNTVRKYLTSQTMPAPVPRRPRPSKLDAYKGYIQDRIADYPLTATGSSVKFKKWDLMEAYHCQDYIHNRPQCPCKRFSGSKTKPGVQAQVDWSECNHLNIDGRQKRLLLQHDPRLFPNAVCSLYALHCTHTLIQCHLNAFEYFGGYTEEIMYDNIKTVILKRALRASDHQWNPKFEDFFSQYGFIPRLCKPYCPQTKGKIENTVGYIKRDFLLGGIFSSLDDMNRQLLQWCNRVNATPHGTTNEIPFDHLHQENLKPLRGVSSRIRSQGDMDRFMRPGVHFYPARICTLLHRHRQNT